MTTNFDLVTSPDEFGLIDMDVMRQVAAQYETAHTQYLQMHLYSALTEGFTVDPDSQTKVDEIMLETGIEIPEPSKMIDIFREAFNPGARYLVFETLNFEAVYNELQRRMLAGDPNTTTDLVTD